MRVSALVLAVLCAGKTAGGFVVPSFVGRRASSAVARHHASSPLHEFDFLLGEGEGFSLPSKTTTRRRVVIPGIENERAIQMTSSATFMPDSEALNDEQASEEADPYDDVFAEQLSKIEQYEERQEAKGFDLQDYLKNSDLGDIIVTLAIPAIVIFAVGRWGSKKAYGAFEEKAGTTLESFAKEMIYHDGDFEEMKMCQADYSRRLVWLGPKKTDVMLKRYLEVYAKKKTVSPQSIR
jgi:hypothetical protein